MLINGDKIMNGNLFKIVSIVAAEVATICVGLHSPASAAPSSYQQTCNNIVISGNRISASCRKINGKYRQTSLVLKGIENIDGTLQVTDATKVSNYQLSCSAIKISGDVINANCKKKNGAPNPTSITLNGIENIDGILKYTSAP
jgi:CVNH domain